MTYQTNNPVGSVDVRDLYDNAEAFDNFSAGPLDDYPDRFGVPRQSLQGIRNASQYVDLGPYAAGLNFTSRNQVFSYNPGTGAEFYAPGPSITMPYTTTGVGAAEIANFRSVGDATLRSDMANATDAAKGADLVGYRNRTTFDRLSEESSLLDTAGIVGGGVGDNLAAINSAISSAAGRSLFIPDGRYAVSARPTNAESIEYTGPGAILLNTSFGPQQINTYTTRYLNAVHKEHLYKAYKRLTTDGQLKIFAYGDSTVAGGNGETAPYTIDNMILRTLANKGISNVAFVNRGVSGTSVTDMNALGDIDPLFSSATDLFIIKYGINDFPKDVTTFYNNFRAKLLAIRAATNGGVHNLSILLMGPSTTYDIPNGRDANWYEKLRGVYLSLCEEFQCSYYDTYAQIQDSSTAATYWMDNPFGDGRGVHMLDVGQNWIWPQMIDWAFGFGETRAFAKNNFQNGGAASGTVPVATTVGNFNYGVSIFRCTDGPVNGQLMTIRHTDGGAYQTLFGTGASPKQLYRSWNVGATAWTGWSGSITTATLLNGWVAFGATRATPGFYRDGNRGYACGTIKGGTTTVGTTLFTVPVELRPLADHVCLNRGASGGVGIGINAAGNVFLQSAGDATETCLDNLSWPIA